MNSVITGVNLIYNTGLGKKGKIKKALKATGLILKNPVLLNRVLSDPPYFTKIVSISKSEPGGGRA